MTDAGIPHGPIPAMGLTGWFDELGQFPKAPVKKPRKHGNRAMRRKRDHDRWSAIGRPIDRLNATVYDAQGRYLHPTKGFRKDNPKRTLASSIVDGWKRGLVDYNAWEMKKQLAQIGEQT